MESLYWVVSMYMVVFGPATLSVIAGRLCARYLEHVSKRRGGWAGLIVGLAIAPLLWFSCETFVAVLWTESMLQFNLASAALNGVAVAITCVLCFVMNHIEKERIWNSH